MSADIEFDGRIRDVTGQGAIHYPTVSYPMAVAASPLPHPGPSIGGPHKEPNACTCKSEGASGSITPKGAVPIGGMARPLDFPFAGVHIDPAYLARVQRWLPRLRLNPICVEWEISEYRITDGRVLAVFYMAVDYAESMFPKRAVGISYMRNRSIYWADRFLQFIEDNYRGVATPQEIECALNSTRATLVIYADPSECPMYADAAWCATHNMSHSAWPRVEEEFVGADVPWVRAGGTIGPCTNLVCSEWR